MREHSYFPEKPLERSHQVMFIGGCQVDGYPVGRQSGFVERCRVALRSHSINLEPTVVSPFKLSQSAKIESALGLLNPEIIVLQVGHFEMVPSQSSSWMRKLGAAGLDPTVAVYPSPLRSPTTRTLWRAKQLVKGVLHSLGLGFQVDPLEIRQKLEQFLLDLRKRTQAKLLILSPLPAADVVLRQVRISCAPHFMEVGREFGADVLDLIGDGDGPLFDLSCHYDNLHLNSRGHEMLAEILTERIAAILQPCRLSAATVQHQCVLGT